MNDDFHNNSIYFWDIEIFIYGNFYSLQNVSSEGLKIFPSLVRGCPFIQIVFNGNIRTSFTESYINGLPHV